MSSWCSSTDVESQLGSVTGQNFGADQINAEIVNATILLKAELGAIIAPALIDAWDANLDAVPPVISVCCAKSAAAQLLQAHVVGESKSDRQSKAGGLYSEYTDFLKRVIANKSIVATSASDNTPIATGTASIVSSSANRARKFSESSDTDTEAGTLDNL